jgi:hypothetical protein
VADVAEPRAEIAAVRPAEVADPDPGRLRVRTAELVEDLQDEADETISFAVYILDPGPSQPSTHERLRLRSMLDAITRLLDFAYRSSPYAWSNRSDFGDAFCPRL